MSLFRFFFSITLHRHKVHRIGQVFVIIGLRIWIINMCSGFFWINSVTNDVKVGSNPVECYPVCVRQCSLNIYQFYLYETASMNITISNFDFSSL